MKYSIEIFKNGQTSAPGPEMFYLSEWDNSYNLHTYFFQLKSGNRTILVDTGCGDTDIINKMLFKEFKGKISFDLPEEERIQSYIKKRRIIPEKVDYVIISHLHHDHSSNVGIFKNAKVVLSRKGWLEYMKKKRPYYYNDALFPTEPIQYISSLPAEKIILAGEEEEILPGLKVFYVGGHTPCCMAVEAETQSGKVVMTSDVAFLKSNVKNNHPVGLFYNLWECFEAYKKISSRADIVLTSHDPDILDKDFPSGLIK
ncbi:MAG TPA: MBL fold metallo-hydrolase [Actinobacteria bacterium]|jgi:glyoxylase-like metal-dependent hydrolase (beta-lactamase superfamily II)|nr:MBL fold metallo-hydrolase [Actinomycetota bacterium]